MPSTSHPFVAEICLYGTQATGTGWLARGAGIAEVFGSGEPDAGVSCTDAIWSAVDALRARGCRTGLVAIIEPAGRLMAHADLSARIPTFGDLAWEAAPVFVIAALPDGDEVCVECGRKAAHTADRYCEDCDGARRRAEADPSTWWDESDAADHAFHCAKDAGRC